MARKRRAGDTAGIWLSSMLSTMKRNDRMFMGSSLGGKTYSKGRFKSKRR